MKTFNSIEDLVFDKSFRDWILNKDEGNARFWEEWMLENSDKRGIVNHAKAIVHALSVDYHNLSDLEISYEVERILEKIETGTQLVSNELVDADPPARTSLVSRGRVWASAAAVILICLCSFYYLFIQSPQPLARSAGYELPVHGKTGSMVLVNNSDSIQTIQLSDSSKVLLSRRSRLTYEQNSSGNNRVVYLTGEAFFIVKKDPARPFFVYTKNIVTKVLGTSFRVKAYDNENSASVNVESGKVSVFRKQDLTKQKAISDKLNAFLISRNQKIEYDTRTGQLSKTIVENPSVTTSARSDPFIFRATPLAEVFKTLEKAYGIKIMYDEDAIQSFSLSATLGNENYYEKLNLICKAVNASYEIIDGNIFITFKQPQ